jgi:hypothetical protein
MSTPPVVPPHVSFFQHIANFFHNLQAELAKGFTILFGDEGPAILAEIEAAGKAGLNAVAMTAVKNAATIATTDSAAARSQAFNEIKSNAVAQGLTVKNSIINLLLEAAVQRLGASSTTTAPAP